MLLQFPKWHCNIKIVLPSTVNTVKAVYEGGPWGPDPLPSPEILQPRNRDAFILTEKKIFIGNFFQPPLPHPPKKNLVTAL